MSSGFSAPIDLSVLPGYEPAHWSGPRRVVFVGRTSTREHQDPVASLLGQAQRAASVLREGEEFQAYYWDIESGALDLSERGQGSYAPDEVPLPRDGGLPEMLEAAQRGEMDAVACEEISRSARDTYTSMSVEKILEKVGVELLCANEPHAAPGGYAGARTGQVMMRRGGQMWAEIARLELAERSERGQYQHAAQGYAHGFPPYGYVDRAIEDKPSTWNEGRYKRVLELDPDPRRPDTVAEVFRLRIERGWHNSAIAHACNADPDRHPCPTNPIGRSARRWLPSQIDSMIKNPKYTGYMVYNRKASSKGGKPKPISQWVWSPQPTHPAIIDLDTWVRAQQVRTGTRTNPRTPLERLRQAAAARGVEVELLRSSHHHVLYRIGDALVPLPRQAKALPETAVRALLQAVEDR